MRGRMPGSWMATFGRMAVVVLVPGYGGRVRAVERWRINVALRTLRVHGGGQLVVSGHRGEAERLAAIAANQDVFIEPTARTTWENVERSVPFLDDAPRIAVATDRFHTRVAEHYLRQIRPDLARRLVKPNRPSWRGWWIQAGGTGYRALRLARRVARRRRSSVVEPRQRVPQIRTHTELPKRRPMARSQAPV